MLFLALRQSRTIYLDFLEDSINFTVLSLNFNTPRHPTGQCWKIIPRQTYNIV